jgi:hypothetical protein
MPKKFDPFVGAHFANGKINWQSRVSDLKYIGPHLTNQLNAAGIDTLESVVVYLVEAANLSEIGKLLAELTRSPSINECKGMDENPPQPYLPRAFNRMGFNALADLLHFAATGAYHNDPFDEDIRERLNEYVEELPDGNVRQWLVRTFNEKDGANIGAHADVRAARRCPCWKTDATCGADAGCQWIPRSAQNPTAGCVPQNMTLAGNMDEAGHRVAPMDIFPNTPAGRAAMQAGEWRVRGVTLPGPNGGFLVRIPIRQSTRTKRRRTGNT